MSRRYLLDSGPAQDFLFRRHGVEQEVSEAVRRGARVGLCTPVLGEIVGGLEGSASREAPWVIARRRLGQLVCWAYDRRAAYEYGRIVAALRRLGRPMQQIDVQVAAIAFALGDCTVVTADSDLAAVPGLRVENWTVPGG